MLLCQSFWKRIKLAGTVGVFVVLELPAIQQCGGSTIGCCRVPVASGLASACCRIVDDQLDE